MMKWIRDNTGRFPYRPFYELEEIDYECESVITSFLLSKYSSISYPISTNDLTILLEREAEGLDLYADLSNEEGDVEGITKFVPNRKPWVQIARELTEQEWRENRLRTTLTHELGHVKFHNFIWLDHQKELFAVDKDESKHRCKRETIIGASKTDWMEWQAGYSSGAFLMPISPLKDLVISFYNKSGALAKESVSSPGGVQLIRRVSTSFQVSEDAARVRLLQLNFLTEGQKKTPKF